MRRTAIALLCVLGLLAAPAASARGQADLDLVLQGAPTGSGTAHDLWMGVREDGSTDPLPSSHMACVLAGQVHGAFAWRFDGLPDDLAAYVAMPDGRARLVATLVSDAAVSSGLVFARIDRPGQPLDLMEAHGAVGSTYVPSLLPGTPVEVSIEWKPARDGPFLVEFGGEAASLLVAFCPDLPVAQPAVTQAEAALGDLVPLVRLGGHLHLGLDHIHPTTAPPAPEAAPPAVASADHRESPGLEGAAALVGLLAMAVAVRARARR